MTKTLRQKINDGGRKVGNFFYDGLGDVLAEEVSPKGMLGLAMAGYFGVASVGCATGSGYTNFRGNDEPAMSTMYKKSKLMRNIMDKTKFIWSDKVKQDMEAYNQKEDVNRNRFPENVHVGEDGLVYPNEGFKWEYDARIGKYKAVPR